MNGVTNTLFTFVLVLLGIVLLIILALIVCAASYASRQKALPPWLSKWINQIMREVGVQVPKWGQNFGEGVKRGLSNSTPQTKFARPPPRRIAPPPEPYYHPELTVPKRYRSSPGIASQAPPPPEINDDFEILTPIV